MQAALDIPLTVYGTGGQTRAFIHISDTARCIQLAIENPPAQGAPVEILNQIAETRRVRDLAEMVATKAGAKISYVNNPRNEAAENELEVYHFSQWCVFIFRLYGDCLTAPVIVAFCYLHLHGLISVPLLS